VLYALGFNIQAESENVTQLFPMGSADHPISVCYILLPGENLDNTTMGRNWAEKIIHNLREHEMQWGLLTNGEQWRIYHQDEPTPYETYLEIDLAAILADKAREAYQIFHKFMRAENFTSGEDGRCQFDVFKQESQDKIDYIEKELENALKQKEEGGQGVLSSLCMGYVEYLRQNGTPNLEDEELRRKIYHGAMLYMFRLLFLYYADARGLLSDDNHQLLADVRQAAYEMSHLGNASEKSYRLWQDLETIFVDIDQTYNGGLFNPHESEFTLFIEESKILDVYLAPAVYHLAFYHEKSGEERLISYKDMSVRHLGTLYEGLLEHKLYIAKEDTEVRITKGLLKFIPLSKGGKAIQGSFIPKGQSYFGSDVNERKSTGSYYTPDYIVDAIVRKTIVTKLHELHDEFLISQKPYIDSIHRAVGKNEQQRLVHLLSSETESFARNKILTMKILDPAMGSGHFLVNAANLISNAITEMLNALDLQTSVDTSTKLWRRDVVENCLYGVDINPLAVELTKLSLWILSMSDEKPLSFLEHHLKTGNSLVGSRIDELDLYPTIRSNKRPKQKDLFSKRQDFQLALMEALSRLNKISKTRSTNLSDILSKKDLLMEVDDVLEPYKNLADIHMGIKCGNQISEWEYSELIENIESTKDIELPNELNCFHWELEFPFLLTGDGFDFIIGNPPYGASLSEQEKAIVGQNYPLLDSQNETYLLFVEKSLNLVKREGMIGMIIPNTWLTNLKGDNFSSNPKIIICRNQQNKYSYCR
jgi:type I restriction-modification system DNA methylase subunit